MKSNIPLSSLVVLILLLSACKPVETITTPGVPVPTEVSTPTAIQPVTPPLPLPTSTKTVDETVDELINIIEVSDPATPRYDPGSAAYARFPEALKKLAMLNSSSNNAASMLAYAMGFPRQDSILAAQTLISLGPDWAATDLPTLIGYLQYQRPAVRMYSAIVLSTIGDKASCSLGELGPHLWDADPYVRTSAALAIQGITGMQLVAAAYLITPDKLVPSPVEADTPDGKIVGTARVWWTESGSKVNWHPSYDLCDP